jgi:hypothetical protein
MANSVAAVTAGIRSGRILATDFTDITDQMDRTGPPIPSPIRVIREIRG